MTSLAQWLNHVALKLRYVADDQIGRSEWHKSDLANGCRKDTRLTPRKEFFVVAITDADRATHVG